MEMVPSYSDPDALLAGRTILLVDDQEAFCLGCGYQLRQHGATVHEVASVEAAQEVLLRDPVPDVVLLDNDLGWGRRGLEVAVWMRTQPHLSHTLRVGWSWSEPSAVLEGAPDASVYHAVYSKPNMAPDAFVKECIEPLRDVLARREELLLAETRAREQGAAPQAQRTTWWRTLLGRS
jgi:CheY-like chemotaxis protein